MSPIRRPSTILPMPAALLERIQRFVASPGSGSFEQLACDAFAFQFERIEPFRRLCRARSVEPGRALDWREIPLVPTGAFRRLRLAADEPKEEFHSSGTTGEATGVHHHPYPDLYRETIDRSFPEACLPPGGSPPMLSLVPDRGMAPHSSLSFMVDHLLGRFAGEPSITAFGRAGVDGRAARTWLAGRQRAGRPGVVLATAFALADLLDFLERLDLRFRLPAGSTVFETGGYKGRRRELARAELVARVDHRLGVPGSQMVREYGMTELTSQIYTRALAGGDPDLFVPPPWVRARVLDPLSLDEAPAGEPGLLAIFDLANVGSAVHVLTQDLGLAEGVGFRLLGRAGNAELRGCSLTVESLAGGVEGV